MDNDDISLPRDLFLVSKTLRTPSQKNLRCQSDRGEYSRTLIENICGGEREYKHAQSESNRKQDIRERVVHSFQDFFVLSLLLDDDEREKIFQEEIGDQPLHESLKAMVSFVYRGLDQDEDRLSKIIEHGLYLGANMDKSGRWAGKAVDVDVSINIEYEPEIDELLEMLEDGKGDRLTPAEVGVLVRSGEVDSHDMQQLEETEKRFPGVAIRVDLETGEPRYAEK